VPEKKRQHYVPKFLLKQFSIDGNDKQINIYNITNDTIIDSASLKEQAAESYFYGKDGVIEDSFGKIETVAAKVFNEIIGEKLPPQNTSNHSVILYFALTLGARTLYKADEQVELVNKLMKKIASLDPKLKDHLDDFEIKVENPLSMTLKAVATSLPLAVDLKYKLLINKTKTPFVISDNPVVYYNNFLEERKKIGSNIGVAVKGLQIFLPISPSHLLIFYDSAVYKVNGAKRNIFEIENSNDILSLNGLQFLNANLNVYYNSNFSSVNLKNLKNSYEKYRRSRKTNLSEYREVNSTKEVPNILLQFSAEDIKCKLNLSFIKTLKKAKDYDLGNKLVHLRNENLVRIHREFSDMVDEKKYKPSEFNNFIMDKLRNAT